MAFTINSFNVGSNLSVQLLDDFGDKFSADQLGHLTDFTANSDSAIVTIRPITKGGKPVHRRIPGGWSGQLSFERYSGAMVNFIAALDNLFYTRGITPNFSINCLIQNPDASQDRYTFTGVQLSRESFGNFRGNSNVSQTLSFNAQELIVPGNVASVIGLATA